VTQKKIEPLEPDERRLLEKRRRWLRTFWLILLIGIVGSWFLEPEIALLISMSSPLVAVAGLIIIPRCPRCNTNLSLQYLATILHYGGVQCPRCGIDASELSQ
jgi:hypothetical protein